MKVCFSRLRPIISICCLLLIGVTIAFIWRNSIESQSESNHRSEEVAEEVKEVIERYTDPENPPEITNHLVRKMAHFSEFFVLGSEICLLLFLIRKTKLRFLLVSLLAGLLIASIDETIQIFTGRGPQISDVLLDFCGFFAGVLLVFCLGFIIIKLSAKWKRQISSAEKQFPDT